jgi:hypothetical protein
MSKELRAKFEKERGPHTDSEWEWVESGIEWHTDIKESEHYKSIVTNKITASILTIVFAMTITGAFYNSNWIAAWHSFVAMYLGWRIKD